MKTSINISLDLVPAAATAGFDAVELHIAPDGPLNLHTTEAHCQEIADQIHHAGLELSALALTTGWQHNYASPNPADRQAARDHTLAALDRAAWLGADTVIILPAVVGRQNSPQPLIAYEDAYSLALEALSDLRFEAQPRAVRLACLTAWTRFLLSPMETRTFIDTINSPWVGLCLELGAVLPGGYPQDWLATLSHRILSLRFTDFRLNPTGDEFTALGTRCPLGEGDVDWPAVNTAIGTIRYPGSATVMDGPPADQKRRLTEVLSRSPSPPV